MGGSDRKARHRHGPRGALFMSRRAISARRRLNQAKRGGASISMGAVYMGALTYIGNAPNFMIYAIASERGVKMPSFFGYLVWSLVVLMPVFVAVTYLFVGFH